MPLYREFLLLLLPAQILYVNLATDGIPKLALGLSPPDIDPIKRPPRNPKESIFSKDVKAFPHDNAYYNLIVFASLELIRVAVHRKASTP
ncbi:MAG: cation transporting ATPase C-terminal domain-containing protein [Candidatus Bathyarchaeia archaeon]